MWDFSRTEIFCLKQGLNTAQAELEELRKKLKELEEGNKGKEVTGQLKRIDQVGGWGFDGCRRSRNTWRTGHLRGGRGQVGG